MSSRPPRPGYGIPAALLAAALLSLGSPPARAQETPLPTPQELVEREKARPRIEALLGGLTKPPKPGEEPPTFHQVCTGLIGLGPVVLPFMAAELDLPTAQTFHVAAYVSGRVGGPEAIAALRKAVAVADGEEGPFAEARKQWAVFGLALAGSTDAIDLALTGKHRVAWPEFYEDMRLLEVLAGVLGPPAVPVLLRQLDALAEDETGKPDRVFVLRALGRVADTGAVGAVAARLGDADPRVRAEAVATLGKIGDPSTAARVIAALDDPDTGVQSQASLAILDLKPVAKTRELLARLETLTDADLRGRLYETLGELRVDGTLEAFRSHWNRPDPYERALLLYAIGRLGDRKALPLLRQATADKDLNIVLQAIRAIAAIGGEGALDTLVALTSDARPLVANAAAETVAELRVKRGAPRIAGRLVSMLAQDIVDFRMRDTIRLLAESVVTLRYADPLEDLRLGAARQSDPEIKATLDAAVSRLALVAANGDDVAKWSAATANADPATRRLAVERLGEIGNKAAGAALVAAFDKATETDARMEIVRAMGSVPSHEMQVAVARVLEDPAWDDESVLPVRAIAAWSARRLGGSAMLDALRRSAERRQGQDGETLVYLAQLGGASSLPTLRAVRWTRLARFDWRRGHEQDLLDWILRELSAGRSIRKLDVAPEKLILH